MREGAVGIAGENGVSVVGEVGDDETEIRVRVGIEGPEDDAARLIANDVTDGFFGFVNVPSPLPRSTITELLICEATTKSGSDR